MRQTTKLSRKKVTVFRREQILRLASEGRTQQFIADNVGVTRQTVSKTLKKMLERPDQSELHADSYRRLLTQRHERMLEEHLPDAINPDNPRKLEAADRCVNIMKELARINGVIPEKALVDMRTQEVTVNADAPLLEIVHQINHEDSSRYNSAPPEDGTEPRTISQDDRG